MKGLEADGYEVSEDEYGDILVSGVEPPDPAYHRFADRVWRFKAAAE